MRITRSDILDAACTCFVDAGPAGVSMRGLARELGVTAPALYRHFESKEEVLLGVVSEAYDRLARYLYRALEGRTPLERFRLAGEAYLTFALENPRMYLTMYAGASMLGRDTFPEDIAQRGCAIGQFWNDRVRECMEAGYLRPGDPDELGTTLWAHAHGLLSLYLRGILVAEEDEFRAIFHDSGARMMAGVGTEKLALEMEALAARNGEVGALTA